jgi:hypothetical protein
MRDPAESRLGSTKETNDAERMIQHVAEHAEPHALAVALCALAESLEQRPPISDAIAAVRAWLEGESRPPLEDAWLLDARGESLAARGLDGSRELAASFFSRRYRCRTMRGLRYGRSRRHWAASSDCSHEDASALLADRLRAAYLFPT